MSWKKVLLVALVVLLVLIGLPLLMPGMGGAAVCHDCGPAAIAGAGCTLAAVLAAAILFIALVALRFGARRDDMFDLLLAAIFDRPPQTA